MRKIDVFRKDRPRDAIELPRRGQVAAERLLDDDARVLGQTRGAEPLDHRLEQRRWNGEVVRRAPGIAQRLLERGERRRVVVVAARHTAAARADGAAPADRRSGPACPIPSVARCVQLPPDSTVSRRRRRPEPSSTPRFAIAYSAGKIILWARSPVTPNSTSASDGAAVRSRCRPSQPPSCCFSSCPPNCLRMAESTRSA